MYLYHNDDNIRSFIYDRNPPSTQNSNSSSIFRYIRRLWPVLLIRNISSHCSFNTFLVFLFLSRDLKVARKRPISDSNEPSYFKNSSPRSVNWYPNGLYPAGMSPPPWILMMLLIVLFSR